MYLKHGISHLFTLYGRRNAMFLRGDKRALYLSESLRSFWKMIRKGEKDKQKLAIKLASVLARTIGFADSFVDLKLVEAISMKYPLSGCAYCGNKNCTCDSKKRKSITIVSSSSIQVDWTISQWVAHMHDTYGAVNRKNGIQYALLRLREEVDEAVAAHEFDDAGNPRVTLSERREKIALEFADVFAWIFSIADILELDLQSAFTERYGGACDNCDMCPCDCPSPIIYKEGAPYTSVGSITSG